MHQRGQHTPFQVRRRNFGEANLSHEAHHIRDVVNRALHDAVQMLISKEVEKIRWLKQPGRICME